MRFRNWFLLEPQQFLGSLNFRGVYLFQINKMVSVTATVQFHEPNIEDWYATVGSRSDWFHLWSVRFLLQRKKQLNIAQRWEVSLHIWIDSQGNHKSVRNCRRPQLLGWSFTCSHGGSINHFVVEMSNSWFLLVVRSQCFVFFGQSHLKSPFSFNVHPPGISVSVIPQAVAEQEGMWGPGTGVIKHGKWKSSYGN